eukprot:TRINITY_DN12979_c2_g1_i1.p1 TRINITY_DN12979_c2_g1~~TRINITY_DN12979_c2_g1_i1.p1  ORF type:complete len:297 (+),score=16.10 TRINITY_DN12979_c2_g1_i1:73-963(+)
MQRFLLFRQVQARAALLPSTSSYSRTLAIPSSTAASQNAAMGTTADFTNAADGDSRGSGNKFSPEKFKHIQSIVQDINPNGKFPSLEDAMDMPQAWHEMTNTQLLLFCGRKGREEANEERLVRDIMARKKLEWPDAVAEFEAIRQYTKVDVFQPIQGKSLHALNTIGLFPYRIGLISFSSFGLLSVPMVFEWNMVSWFNEAYVTADIPEAKDLETWLEVGSWAWNWMEPPLGTLSFFILCIQMSRNQMRNLGIRPYLNYLTKKRADMLVERFPQYNAMFLRDYAHSAGWGIGRPRL